MQQPLVANNAYGQYYEAVTTPPPPSYDVVQQEKFPEAPKYQDKIWGILFWIQFLVMLGLAVYFGAVYKSDHSNTSSNSNSTTSTNFTADTKFKEVVGIAVGLPIFSAMLSLWLMRSYANCLVWASLLFGFFSSVAMAILMFKLHSTPGMIVFGVVALVNLLWIYVVRKRIPFAVAILETVVDVVKHHSSTILISFLSIFVQAAWNVGWLFAANGVYNAIDTGSQKESGSGKIIAAFLILSYYWTSQVVFNVVLTTCAGVMAEWYFKAPNQPERPTSRALGRAMTTSFGSICYGSFLVAVIQTLRALNRKSENGERNIAAVIIGCILACLESIIEQVNHWAFAYVAIYGISYCDSAKSVFQLFAHRGFYMIINDDLIHGVLVMVSFISGIVSAAGTWVLSSYVVKASEGASIAAVVIAFVLAIIFTSCALKVISACVTALYVCYAEDPAALANTKPQVYNKLTNSFLEAYQSKVVMFR